MAATPPAQGLPSSDLLSQVKVLRDEVERAELPLDIPSTDSAREGRYSHLVILHVSHHS